MKMKMGKRVWERDSQEFPREILSFLIFQLYCMLSINYVVWSGGICFVACQESLQEETPTTKGKKVSRKFFMFFLQINLYSMEKWIMMTIQFP